MPTMLKTGSRLDPDVALPTSARLSMVIGGPVELLTTLSRPHPLEIQAVTAAPTRFAWIDAGPAAVLLYRLGPVSAWAQVAYHPRLPGATEGQPGVDHTHEVRIVLVDRDTRTVKAVHRVRWSATFATVVQKSVTRMAETPFNRLVYQHALSGLHRRYPTPEDLLIDRADAQCTAVPLFAG